ncbi:MAG: hypothetical protein DCC55_05200 [Chloroflexi bacterium]|nr:MAG: hypothetical protein DCC55_05200 [Chloroflexota bacterium]
MNTILTFLKQHRQRLNLAQYGVCGSLSSILLTPRFPASNHVIFLILSEGRPEPVLVAKMPRLAQATAGLEREAANLQRVQAQRVEGFDTIPHLVTLEKYSGHLLLLETALSGQLMGPTVIRRQFDHCCDAVSNWLVEIQGPEPGAEPEAGEWFARLIEQPLHAFTERFPWSREELKLLEQMWTLIAPLRTAKLRFVFEHGDLSHPNLLLLENGKVGVVDWELAQPLGLPTYDLFFFLTYAAFAKEKARTNTDCLAAFQTAFFGPTAWARPWVHRYAVDLSLPTALLTPLFLIVWLRYLVGLSGRLEQAAPALGPFGREQVMWLRENRYYALWQYAVRHAVDLRWD